MTKVEVAAAVADLERLVFTHSLPAETKERVKASLRHLEHFPQLGAPLEGRWQGFRFLLGAWRWLILVYAYLEEEDRVVVVTIQDACSSRSPTAAH